MLLSEFVKIDITNNNLKYYQRKDNNLVIGDIITINISELSINSGYKVGVKCDYCGHEFDMEYRKYLRSIQVLNKNSCKDKNCVGLKMKESNTIKYGVENVMQLDYNRIKAKKTNLEKWGTENPNELEIIKDKIKKTSIEKYGGYYIKTEDFKEKSKASNLKKWSTENPNELEIIKDKIKKTNLEKYGVDNYTKTDECKIKVKETTLEKYGVDNYVKNDDYKNKSRKSNLEKWGSEITSHSEIFRKNNFKIAKHPNYLKFLIDEKVSEFICDCGEEHTFKIGIDNFYHRTKNRSLLCTICYPIGDSVSIKEEELLKFIESAYSGEIIQSYRDGLEIDVFLPELKLGFEFNGLYWHSDKYRDKYYHLYKLNFFKSKGIRIFNVWEDDWNFKRDAIKSQIRNAIGLVENRIYARKCKVVEIFDSKLTRQFLDKNHVQGFVSSKIKIGLLYDGELVSLMTFDKFEGRKKMDIDEWNLNRFCSKLNYSVIGGASKILKYFIDKYNPRRIVSYADKDWSVGNLYELLGFEKVNESKPDYKYLVSDRRIHKSRYRKSSTGISESKLELCRVWDCGKIKYEKSLNIIEKN